MKSLSYLYSKFFKTVLRGKSIVSSQIDETAKIYSGCNVINTSVDRYSYLGYDCEVVNCEIGCFCSIASGVRIGGAEHPFDWMSTSPVFQNVKHSGPKKRFARLDLPTSKKTVIGHDVWIGYNVIVKAGVTIGNGAVIGAGAVVTKDVPPYAVIAGNPGKVIKYRFNDETIEKLDKFQWWDMDEKDLSKIAYLFNDPTVLLDYSETNKI